ncbi:hypothetical protein C8Q73DRAFT_283465 [Cubamyces lactineus]|nr:hypothetical protein C8Q73DRAFT_283465 [Cubamyces lactineus]
MARRHRLRRRTAPGPLHTAIGGRPRVFVKVARRLHRVRVCQTRADADQRSVFVGWRNYGGNPVEGDRMPREDETKASLCGECSLPLLLYRDRRAGVCAALSLRRMGSGRRGRTRMRWLCFVIPITNLHGEWSRGGGHLGLVCRWCPPPVQYPSSSVSASYSLNDLTRLLHLPKYAQLLTSVLRRPFVRPAAHPYDRHSPQRRAAMNLLGSELAGSAPLCCVI